MLVRDLRPQGREPWCTCSRGSAPLRRATSLEAARLYLKLSPTRVESLHVPTSRASRATRPSPRLSIRDGPAPRRLRWTALHRGVRSVWPRSPAPLGRGACKQAGGLSCPRASTEFPGVASPGAPTLCPARRQPLPPARRVFFSILLPSPGAPAQALLLNDPSDFEGGGTYFERAGEGLPPPQ